MVRAVAADAYLSGVLHAAQALAGTDKWFEMLKVLRGEVPRS